jgi:hypothetical protein
LLEELQQGLALGAPSGRGLSRGARLGVSAAVLGAALLLATAPAVGWGVPRLLGAALLVGAVVGGLLLPASVPGARRAGLGVRRALVAGLSLLTLAVLGALAPGFEPLGDFTAHGGPDHALACAYHTLLTGLAAGGALLLLWRRTDPFTPALSGALLGGTGGVVGTLSACLACPTDEGWHLMLGHGLAVSALALLGAAAGRRWLAP